MNTLLIFFLVIVAISIIGIRYKVPPFLTLVGGAVCYGLAIGGNADTVFTTAAMGCASIFNSLGIPILAGSVIAKYLVEEGLIGDIISDIRRVLKTPPTLSAIAGYVIAIPSTCPITAYMVLTPVLERLTGDPRKRSALLYLVAVGSAVGIAFVYPTPVTFPLFDTFKTSFSPLVYDLIIIPLTLIFLIPLIFIVKRKFSWDETTNTSEITEEVNVDAIDTYEEIATKQIETEAIETKATTTEEIEARQNVPEKRFHLKAWSPFIVIFAGIPFGLFVMGLTHASLLQFIMFAGMVMSVLIAVPERRWTGFVLGAKHAGVIIFDICGAGALGYMITQSAFSYDALNMLANHVPLVVIPFALAAMLQTAQGSRIVTSITTASIIGTIPAIATAMNPLALILMIIAGAGIMCFVTDPYFWLLHRTTGDDVKQVFKWYTLPQIVFGIATFVVAFAIQWYFP